MNTWLIHGSVLLNNQLKHEIFANTCEVWVGSMAANTVLPSGHI